MGLFLIPFDEIKINKMRLFYIFLALLFSDFSISQTEGIAGKYQIISDATNAYIKSTLDLHPNGTFEFHDYYKIDANLGPPKHRYGRGTWTVDKKVITLITTESDIDKKYKLNFSGTQGRFIIKSPRDKSDRKIPTSIRFFKSEILPGWNLLKI